MRIFASQVRSNSVNTTGSGNSPVGRSENSVSMTDCGDGCVVGTSLAAKFVATGICVGGWVVGISVAIILFANGICVGGWVAGISVAIILFANGICVGEGCVGLSVATKLVEPGIEGGSLVGNLVARKFGGGLCSLWSECQVGKFVMGEWVLAGFETDPSLPGFRKTTSMEGCIVLPARSPGNSVVSKEGATVGIRVTGAQSFVQIG